VDLAATPHEPWRRLQSVPRWNVPAYYNVATHACDRHPPDKLAMIWDDDAGTERKVTWREMQAESSRVANALRGIGVQPGDRVVAVLRQSPEAAAALLGVVRSGAVLVSISELLADRQIRERLDELDARVLITESRIADRFDAIAPTALMLLDRFDLSAASTSFSTVLMPADAPAFIAYTSGTTGRAKGVLQPHRSMIANEEMHFVQNLREGELYYGIGDWSWWVRKLLGPWQVGAAHLVYRYDRYDPERLLHTLAKHGVTNAFINATAIRVMMRDRQIGRRIPQHFRIATSSNEPLGEEATLWFREQFGVTPLEFYGCTEVGIMVGGSPYLTPTPGSMGTPMPGCHVRLLDDDEREVPPGEAGEICLLARSNPGYPLGYWKRPEDSHRDFGGTWFHTKDVASMDADGKLWFLGRKDDVIKAAGYRIGPFEVEATLRRHPLVQDAAVIGVPDTERGTRVVAYIVLKAGTQVPAVLTEELQTLVKREHAKYAYPREVHYVEDLPRSSTGKTDRTSLRKAYQTPE
jgi:acetyl-CoA synthetase